MIHIYTQTENCYFKCKTFVIWYVNGQGHDMTKTYLESRQPEMQSFIVMCIIFAYELKCIGFWGHGRY